MLNIFERAARQKVRFQSVQGTLTVEDLWDLPLTTTVKNKASLNDLAIATDKKIREMSQGSFVQTDTNTSKEKTLAHLQLDLIVHVIKEKEYEKAKAKEKANAAAEKEILLEALAKKQAQKIDGLSEEEIIAKLNRL